MLSEILLDHPSVAPVDLGGSQAIAIDTVKKPMASNPIQFQSDMSLSTFLKRYGKEGQCQEASALARWLVLHGLRSHGVRCMNCGPPHSERIRGQKEKGAEGYGPSLTDAFERG